MTDTDNSFEGAPTAPLPIAESAGVTAPLPPASPAPAVPGVAGGSAPRRSGHLSTAGIVAIALAGAMAISAVSFGAGWGAHGMVERFGDRRAVAQRAMMGYGNGYGRGMAPQGVWGDRQSQDGWSGQGGAPQDGVASCPRGTW